MVLTLKNIFIANRKFLLKALSLITLSLMVINCGGSSGGSGGTVVVSGTVTYDRVPITEGGLDYSNIVEKPIRRALISAVDANNGNILQNTYSDETGFYSFSVPDSKSVKISVYSQSQNPVIRIQDNSGSRFPEGEYPRFVLQSAAFTTQKGVNVTKSLRADSGYNSTTQSLSGSRDAAPFAILDTCLLAADFFLDKRTITFPSLTVNWSENNTNSGGSIGTSHWSGSQLFILGDADNDTDEYDAHVIVHEWGHYFESVLGRSDSVGGSHTDGDVLDPRVAFSEGWGNALSAMVLYPDSVYKDTSGPGQANTGIMFDVDENNSELNLNNSFKIGWFSENSVQSILYDLFDPTADDAGEDWDLLSTDAGVIYDIFTEDVKESESLVTIFTFMSGFVTRNPSLADDVTALMAKHTIGPIVDEFGTDETNDGGLPGNLPVYKTLDLGDSVTLEFGVISEPGNDNSNLLEDSQYIKVSGVSGNAEIRATGSSSKSVMIAYQGILKDGDSATGSAAAVISSFTFEADKTYIIIVTNDQSSANKSAADITVSLNP